MTTSRYTTAKSIYYIDFESPTTQPHHTGATSTATFTAIPPTSPFPPHQVMGPGSWVLHNPTHTTSPHCSHQFLIPMGGRESPLHPGRTLPRGRSCPPLTHNGWPPPCSSSPSRRRRRTYHGVRTRRVSPDGANGSRSGRMMVSSSRTTGRENMAADNIGRNFYKYQF